ncbi:MAG: hemerythrin domain-containing protein [Melioribacter sp.]|uniref:hemerythrin domain-containing protein n=1 Tax=Rosettibacter primus TaxID=3111523 RepID=UPI00247D796F|nr:hemerythrin domain-containing protein [Melioribacter sp.]
MKRHKALIRLSREHHDGLILAQIIKKGAPHYKGMPSNLVDKKDYTINFFQNYLIKHFNDEENILMKLLQGKDTFLDKLFEQMINEHVEIKLLIDKIKSEENYENYLDKLGYTLEKHIRMEERELFDRIQTVIDDKTLNALEEKLS